MIVIMHDSQRAANNSGRRSQEISGRRPVDGRGTALPGVNFEKEGPADFLLYSAGHRYGDREVCEVIRWKAGLPVVTSNKQTLTSLPTEEEEMAKLILPTLDPHFIHQTHANPAGNGGERWA
jgi:hypothetical protein